MNQLDFQGRHAVVTGGATGLGLGIAQRLLASGGSVTPVGPRLRRRRQGRGRAGRQGACAGGRRQPAALGRQGGGGHAGPCRAHRRAGQQRRHHRAQHQGLGLSGRRLAPGDGGEPHRRLHLLPRGGGPDAHAGLRAHRQHRLGRGQGRQPERQRLQRQQGRRDRADQVARQGTGRHRRARELRDAGRGQDRDLRPDDRRAHRLHAVEDPDGPLRHGRRDRRAGRRGSAPRTAPSPPAPPSTSRVAARPTEAGEAGV